MKYLLRFKHLLTIDLRLSNIIVLYSIREEVIEMIPSTHLYMSHLMYDYFYEIALHLKFLMLSVKGRVQFNPNEDFFEKDIYLMLHYMNNKYTKEDSTIEKDIRYALSAAVLVAQRIICASTLILKYNNENGIRELSEIVGGAL